MVNKMDMKIFGLIYKVLSTTYEWFDAEDTYKLKLWYAMLEDLGENLVKDAVHDWVRTQSKPPTIADIRKAAVCRVNRFLSDEESWVQVQNLCNGLEANLDEYTRQALALVGGSWSVKNSTNSGIIHSQFKNTYNEIINKVIYEQSVSGIPEKLLVEYRPPIAVCLGKGE